MLFSQAGNFCQAQKEPGKHNLSLNAGRYSGLITWPIQTHLQQVLVDPKGANINIRGLVLDHICYYFPSSRCRGQHQHAVAGCDEQVIQGGLDIKGRCAAEGPVKFVPYSSRGTQRNNI